jgi:hypothetical protein
MLSFTIINQLAKLLIGDNNQDDIYFKYLTDNDIQDLTYFLGCAEDDYHMIIFSNRMDRMKYVLRTNNITILEKLFTEIMKLIYTESLIYNNPEGETRMDSAINIINGLLECDSYKLVQDNKNYKLIVANNIVNFSQLDNFDAIKKDHQIVMQRFIVEDYNGACTRIRTMVDNVFDTVHQKITGNYFTDKSFLDKWAWIKKNGLNLVPGKYKHEPIRNLAQNFGNIIENINKLRNNASDAHSLFLLSSLDFQNKKQL